MDTDHEFTAFSGFERVGRGTLRSVLARVLETLEREPTAQILIFDDQTGTQVDFDLRGTLEEVLARVTPPVPPRGRGRPALGVVSREVSLLPRHWEWLESQPAKASGTLRRLVEAARKAEAVTRNPRTRLEAAGRFMWSMAGNLEGFEEASRDLYARRFDSLHERIASWPRDVKAHIEGMIRPLTEPVSAQDDGRLTRPHAAGLGAGERRDPS